MMKTILLAIGVTAALAAPAAHAEISANRLYWLCVQEDTQCHQLLHDAAVKGLLRYQGKGAICTAGRPKLTYGQLLGTFLQHAESESGYLYLPASEFEAYVLSSVLPCAPGEKG